MQGAEFQAMRLSGRWPSARRVALSILVFVACLAVIKANYRSPLYGDAALIAVLSSEDRTPERMAAHEHRLTSSENLRRASLDPRLAGLNRPLRAGDGNEAIGSVPGPAVYVSVDSVEDGVLLIDSVSEVSPTEAKAIAEAVADAYVAELGANQVVPVVDSFAMPCEFHANLLSHPRVLIGVLVLSLFASVFVLLVPSVWFSKRRLPTTLAVTLAVAVFLLDCLFHPMFLGELVSVVVAAILLAAIGVAAARRPWVMLAISLLIWASAPVVHDGFTSASLIGRLIVVAWVLGATAAWATHLSVQGRSGNGGESQ